MCVACRRTAASHELLRLTRTTDGRIVVDTTGKRGGRGAYLCSNPACWDKALKRRSLERALRLPLLLPEDRASLQQIAEDLKQTTVS